ncbi:hypothetical protein [Actinomadura luteofluorescens]|uniref:hypothetical protein n=1 Tax=Actinomadura luteofluorescens TaxID=46163 RepID=UPI003D91260C
MTVTCGEASGWAFRPWRPENSALPAARYMLDLNRVVDDGRRFQSAFGEDPPDDAHFDLGVLRYADGDRLAPGEKRVPPAAGS